MFKECFDSINLWWNRNCTSWFVNLYDNVEPLPPLSLHRSISLSRCAAFKNVIPSVRYDPVSFRYTRGCQSCRYTRRGRQVSTGRRKLCIPRESHSHRTNSPLSVSSLSVLHDNGSHVGVKSRESSEEASS